MVWGCCGGGFKGFRLHFLKAIISDLRIITNTNKYILNPRESGASQMTLHDKGEKGYSSGKLG